MSQKTFTRGAALSTARAMLRQGKPLDIVREHLFKRGATEEIVDSVLEELSELVAQVPATNDNEDFESIETKAYIKYDAVERTTHGKIISEYGDSSRPSSASKQGGQVSPSSKDAKSTTSKTYIKYDALGRTTRQSIQQKQESDYRAAGRSGSSSQVTIGFIIIAAGLIFTLFSFMSAANSPSGGTYIITTGAFVTGGWMIIKGLASGD